jgi:integrase
MHDEPRHDAVSRTTGISGGANIDEHETTRTRANNGKKTARTRSKTDTKYWLTRVFRPVGGDGSVSPNFAVKIQHRGRRVAFGLNTGNKDAAARRAMAIFNDVVDRGLDAVLAERRGGVVPDENNSKTAVTIGQWIEAAKLVFDGAPETFSGYTRSLRQITADIVRMDKTAKRFEPVQSRDYRRKIDAMPLSILTPQATQSWRITFIAKRGTDPALMRAAKISANSTVRQAKSLFGKKIAKFVTIKLPEPIPFSDVEFYPRESMRYHSKIDPAELMRAASQELSETDPGAFLALILALGAGLRRGEIDRLLWRQIDCQNHVIHVETTEAGGLKSADSHAAVAIDPTLATVLQGFKARATSEYVIEADGNLSQNDKGFSQWSRKYRCEAVFDRLIQWLRDHGVGGQKPLHMLRKEAGSLIATEHGVLAASRFLRHADIGITAQFYADHKTRTTGDMSALLPPPNVAELPKKTG